MSDYREYNEEQYQMLRLSITDTGSGICLFRSYSPKEQVEIAQRLKKDLDKSCCIFNMAHIETEDLPRDIAKVRTMLEGYEE